MNDMIQESQRIATQMQNMIPQDTYNNIQPAIANMCVPKVQFQTAIMEYTKTFQRITPPIVVNDIVSGIASEMMSTMLFSLKEKMDELRYILSFCMQRISNINLHFTLPEGFIKIHDRMLFLKIAEEIGFPVYLECDTELQDMLIEIYRDNNNRCDKEKMQQIVMNYYNEDYVDSIFNGFITTNTFKERVSLFREGIKAYQLGLYGAANALFITQMGGMISDIYNELSNVHKFTRTERKEIKKVFELGNCHDNSEKVMLAEVISEQDTGIMTWYQVARYFFNYTYKSGKKDMDVHPKRHMICHGIQTNFNTKEMSLKIILCMDILAELALRIEKMKEDSKQVIIDV